MAVTELCHSLPPPHPSLRLSPFKFNVKVTDRSCKINITEERREGIAVPRNLTDLLYSYFSVAGGIVHLRDWTQETLGPRGKKGDLARKQRRSQALWKTSLCWFHLQHPDGCPVAIQHCPFAHGRSELRERPTAEFLDNL